MKSLKPRGSELKTNSGTGAVRSLMNESCLKAAIKEESKRIKVQRIKNKSPIHL